MATTEETFVLVEMTVPAFHRPGYPVEVESPAAPAIARIIRTYLSNSRAQDDLELLQEANPDARYQIMAVTHIDS